MISGLSGLSVLCAHAAPEREKGKKLRSLSPTSSALHRIGAGATARGTDPSNNLSWGAEVFGTRIDQANENHKKLKHQHKKHKVVGKQDSTRLRFVLFALFFALFVLKQISSST
jgi:hypothetical protein